MNCFLRLLRTLLKYILVQEDDKEETIICGKFVNQEVVKKLNLIMKNIGIMKEIKKALMIKMMELVLKPKLKVKPKLK